MFPRSILLSTLVVLTACSSPSSLLQPDCHSCTTETQAWEKFPFASLRGNWKGSVEMNRNERTAAKKVKSEKRVQMRFLPAADFFVAQKVSCNALPSEAVVVNGLFWDSGSAKQEFEAFVPAEEGTVAYGRLALENLNGQRVCHFRRLGRVMGQNRMGLPEVSFTEGARFAGRQVAASEPSVTELNLEFLRFAPLEASAQAFVGNARRPASAETEEKPPLVIRVSQTSHREMPHGRGQWKGSEEYFYRLWRAE